MKNKSIALTLCTILNFSIAQSQTNQTNTTQQKVIPENAVYQLFPTKNYWTFIKLDTRNGRIWQVQFSVNNDNYTGEFVLNPTPLVEKENEINGRFTLYPTENIYNFLLLDKISGKVVQVQWSNDAKNRGIISVIKSID